MEYKRTSACLMLVALLLLAACGGAGTTQPTTAPGESSLPATVVPVPATAAEAAPTAPAATAAEAATNGPAGTAATSEMNTGATAGAAGDVTKIAVEDGAAIRIVVNGNTTEQQLYQDGVARFKQIFPNVNVTVDVNNDNYETNMKAQFSANTAPDVLLLPPQLLGAFGPQGLLLPLDDAMNTAGVAPSDYVDSPMQLFQIDGKTYGIPKDFGTLVIFVNNQMAQDAGVDIGGIKDWDSLKAAATKMTKGDGPGKTYGMCLNPDIERYGASLLQNGNMITQDGKATFNQESGIQAIDYWYSYKQDGSGELYKEMGKNWCGEAFSGQQAAMVMEGGWLVPFLADPANGATNLQYTAIPLPLPAGGKQGDLLFTNAFGVNAKTQFPNAAAALVIFLTSAANQQALLPSGLATPSLKALASDPYFNNNATAKVLVDAGSYGTSSDLALGGPEKKGDIASTLNQALESVFLGQAATKDALDQAAQQVDEILGQ